MCSLQWKSQDYHLHASIAAAALNLAHLIIWLVARAQGVANPVPWLATRAVKMELLCPLGITSYPRTIIHSKSFVGQLRSIRSRWLDICPLVKGCHLDLTLGQCRIPVFTSSAFSSFPLQVNRVQIIDFNHYKLARWQVFTMFYKDPIRGKSCQKCIF